MDAVSKEASVRGVGRKKMHTVETSRMRRVVEKFKSNVLFRNIGGTFAIKGASVVVQLLSVPAYISYFGDDGLLGVWYTLIAALNWILIFDFGVGNGLRNNLSKALAAKDFENAKRLVSTAYIVRKLSSMLRKR